jgi:hypothetical protein
MRERERKRERKRERGKERKRERDKEGGRVGEIEREKEREGERELIRNGYFRNWASALLVCAWVRVCKGAGGDRVLKEAKQSCHGKGRGGREREFLRLTLNEQRADTREKNTLTHIRQYNIHAYTRQQNTHSHTHTPT